MKAEDAFNLLPSGSRKASFINGERPHIYHAFGRWHVLKCTNDRHNLRAIWHVNKLNDLLIYGESPVTYKSWVRRAR